VHLQQFTGSCGLSSYQMQPAVLHVASDSRQGCLQSIQTKAGSYLVSGHDVLCSAVAFSLPQTLVDKFLSFIGILQSNTASQAKL
jgi:hypothetical protein